MTNINKTIFALTALALGSSPLLASELAVPNSFTSGTPAVAAEVNDNFAAVETAVNDNDARVTANETSIADNTTAIADNTTAIADNADLIADLSVADGIAFAPSPNSSFLLSTADAIVRTLTVQAPADGTVVFNYASWFTCTSAAACVARCSVNPGGSTLDTSRFAISSVASGQYQTMAVTGALPVSAGSDLTLNLVCDMFTGVGSLGDPQLNAIFSSNSVSP